MSTTKLKAPNGSADKGLTVQTEYGSYVVASDGSVSPDSRAVQKLFNAGFSFWDANLPQGDTLLGGAHTVTAGEDTANTCAIATGLTSIVAYHVQILRAGIDVTNLAAISKATGTITVADNSTNYVLTTGDVINWLALGVL